MILVLPPLSEGEEVCVSILQTRKGSDVARTQRRKVRWEHALGLGLIGQTEQGKLGKCMTPLLPVFFLVIMVSPERYSV